jgi:hypothetical protein
VTPSAKVAQAGKNEALNAERILWHDSRERPPFIFDLTGVKINARKLIKSVQNFGHFWILKFRYLI